MVLSNETLENFYKMNFGLQHHHKYSLTELDAMLPFERDILISLLINQLEEDKAQMEKENGRNT